MNKLWCTFIQRNTAQERKEPTSNTGTTGRSQVHYAEWRKPVSEGTWFLEGFCHTINVDLDTPHFIFCCGAAVLVVYNQWVITVEAGGVGKQPRMNSVNNLLETRSCRKWMIPWVCDSSMRQRDLGHHFCCIKTLLLPCVNRRTNVPSSGNYTGYLCFHFVEFFKGC